MSSKKLFDKYIEAGNDSGEVIAIDKFLASVKGLDSVKNGAVVIFENGVSGMVYSIKEEYVDILLFEKDPVEIGTMVVVKEDELNISVSAKMLGRIINPLGNPIDSKGLILKDKTRRVFNSAITFAERDQVKEQLETGVCLVDTLFPIVYGQRIAVMGDNNSGKTTFASQMAINQAKKNKVIVYVLMGKRRPDIEMTVSRFEKAGVLKNMVIVIADIFDALPMTYIAPYAGCAVAEYFWHEGKDTIIIYDDLASHAKAFREMSLLVRANPGREAYPGEMFHAHSSLLERAGRLADNGKTLSAIPLSVTPNDDITSYLSTSLISITDGQIIFDNKIMREGIRPAVNIGLSVSRVGGRGQTDLGRKIASSISAKLAEYRATLVTSHFVTGQSPEALSVLRTGERIMQAFSQKSTVLYSLVQEQVILNTVLLSEQNENLDVNKLIEEVMNLPADQLKDDNIEKLSAKLAEGAVK